MSSEPLSSVAYTIMAAPAAASTVYIGAGGALPKPFVDDSRA